MKLKNSRTDGRKYQHPTVHRMPPMPQTNIKALGCFPGSITVCMAHANRVCQENCHQNNLWTWLLHILQMGAAVRPGRKTLVVLWLNVFKKERKNEINSSKNLPSHLKTSISPFWQDREMQKK